MHLISLFPQRNRRSITTLTNGLTKPEDAASLTRIASLFPALDILESKKLRASEHLEREQPARQISLKRLAPVDRKISTLDPKKLQSSDFIDFSGRRAPCIEFLQCGSCEIRYAWQLKLIPFPPSARGFLYYHIHPHLPPTCGQVRFRLTASNDPSTFADGTDLLGIDGAPWSMQTSLLMFPHYDALRRRLLRDRLVRRSFSETLKQLQMTFKLSRSSFREMNYLEQPFMLDMSLHNMRFRLLTPSDVRYMLLVDLFVDTREFQTHDVRPCPYKGRLLVRFERSTLPIHIGTNTVVLRVLKILEPITFNIPTYDVYIPLPEAGKLLLCRKYSDLLVRTWDLDDETNHVASALKILPSLTDVEHPTLDPNRLKASDFVDISRKHSHPRYPESLLSYEGRSTLTSNAFPQRTRGFLYYYRDSALPENTGELRFRLTGDCNPALFAASKDLIGPTGSPWSMGLAALTHPGNASIKDQLLRDKLVTESLLHGVAAAQPDEPEHPADLRRRELHYLEEPFPIDMDTHMARIRVILNDKAETVILRNLFVFRQNEGKGNEASKHFPYRGTLLVRFERSTLVEHEGSNTLVLRVLRILRPIELVIPELEDTIIVPSEGSLLSNFLYGRRREVARRIMAWNLDSNPRFSCLRSLPSMT
ncbi:hypothetical protein H0H92_007220 [Tricholoma furcatifolium]|nr:hypothetical protein H0H92_007220 [Tricholoma furcatifolium]